jgi:hypothetical protein
MGAHLTNTANVLKHLFSLALKGLPADVSEPEGPFFDEQEQEWYDLLHAARSTVKTYTGIYQTTPADYQAKCGQGTSGASVTRTATSTVDQATANANAKTAALNAIQCPVPFPLYGTTLTKQVPVDPSGEVTLTLAGTFPDGVFKFNAAPGGDSTAKGMIVNIGGVFAFLLDFPATYTNSLTGWTFASGGKRYTGTFVDGSTNANPFD